jgi:acetyl-CoA/propionyl-CoA carboxylase biotin carboxyl carrier protein
MKIRLFSNDEPVDVTLTAGEALIEKADGTRRFAFATVARPSASGGAIRVEGRTFRYLARRDGSRLQIAIGGESFEFELSEPAQSRGGHGTASPETRSPMPGKVLQVSARVGDPVAPGDPLLILEAMKMENVLVAEIAGRIAAVHVVPGDMVDPGKLLVVITPDES